MTERNDSRTLNPVPVPARLLGLREVMRMTGLSRSSIYDLRARGRFPQPVRVTEYAVRWIEEEVLDFIASRPRAGAARTQPAARRGR